MRKLIVLSVIVFIFSTGSLAGENLFSKLNFTVHIDYTPKALHKLKRNKEKVIVSVIIDQYGKQYMEDEAVAFKDIMIDPGDKAFFHGIPLRESSYRFKANKKYRMTVFVLTARRVFENNLLSCYEKSRAVDYDAFGINGKVFEFKCELIYK